MSSQETQLSKKCLHKPGDDWEEGCCTNSKLKATINQAQALSPLAKTSAIRTDVNPSRES